MLHCAFACNECNRQLSLDCVRCSSPTALHWICCSSPTALHWICCSSLIVGVQSCIAASMLMLAGCRPAAAGGGVADQTGCCSFGCCFFWVLFRLRINRSCYVAVATVLVLLSKVWVLQRGQQRVWALTYCSTCECDSLRAPAYHTCKQAWIRKAAADPTCA